MDHNRLQKLSIFNTPSFHLVFLPTTLASLPPRVMLPNRSAAPRDSATDVQKNSRKGIAPEWEWPNRSVVKNSLMQEVRQKSGILECRSTGERGFVPSTLYLQHDCWVSVQPDRGHLTAKMNITFFITN